jgi:hypothetical protein
VAIWRAPALETLIRGPLDASGVTEDAIQSLVTQGAREGEQLEFKVKPHLPAMGGPASGSSNSDDGAESTEPASSSGGRSDWKSEQEWAKDVCQFANHRGGLLVIGIKERSGVAVGANPTVTDAASLEQRLRVVLSNYTAPTPRIDVIAVSSASGGSYMAVVVPPSELGPHAVTDGPGSGRRHFYFPVRDGADVRWMGETEVADRYRRRSLARADYQAAMRQMVEAGAEQLGLTSDLWLYVATNPESPSSARLDGAMVKQIRHWHDSYGFYSPLERGMDLNPVGFPAPSRVTFTGHHARADAEVTDPRDGYLELYADGRAFAAKPITFDTAEDASADQVGLMTLVDDTSIILDVALSWTIHQAGSWGSVDVQAGLIDSGELDLPYTTPLTLYTSTKGDLRRVRNTRLVRRPVRALVTADLSACETAQGRMAAVHDVASTLLHHFGVPEADMVEPDGTLIGSNWGYAKTRQVESWAADHGVPYRLHPLP